LAAGNKAPISDSYQRFVAAGSGIIEERFGHRSWRLNLSSSIDAGESWQLGAFVAHELNNAGRLAEKENRRPQLSWRPARSIMTSRWRGSMVWQ
jgi:hypothetical protein